MVYEFYENYEADIERHHQIMRPIPGDCFPETPEDSENEDIWNYNGDIYIDYAEIEYHHQNTEDWPETPEDYESEDFDYSDARYLPNEPYEYEHAYGS